MIKEIGVKMFINEKDIPIKSNVKATYDLNDNLILTFKIGNKSLDSVKLIFDKKIYLDIKQ